MKENIFVKDKLKKIALRNYLKNKLNSAGFVDLDIQKSVSGTKLVLYVLKPGLVIGKKGANIRALTDDLENNYGLSKVHIEIGELVNKNLNPKLIVENIAKKIGSGTAWKNAVYTALKEIKEAGAIGAEIVAKGNISGKGQRKRKNRYYFGYLKKAGGQKDLVSFEKITTFPGLGTIGIRLRIAQPDTMFSDKVDIQELAKTYKKKMIQTRLEKEESDAHKAEELLKKEDSENKIKKKKEETDVIIGFEEDEESEEKSKIKKPAKTVKKPTKKPIKK